MNKQHFKKAVENFGASICDEMMIVYYNNPDSDRDKISKAVSIILGAIASARANANVSFDRGLKSFSSPQEYHKAKTVFFKKLFRKIREDFNNAVSEALKVFNEAVPREGN